MVPCLSYHKIPKVTTPQKKQSLWPGLTHGKTTNSEREKRSLILNLQYFIDAAKGSLGVWGGAWAKEVSNCHAQFYSKLLKQFSL